MFVFRKKDDPQAPEALADNDNGEEDGTATGPCLFTVHGLVGEDLQTKPWDVLKSIAVRHLTETKPMLGIGHAKEPESIYHNTYLYPQMFPWLFPYGKGSFNQPAHAGVISMTAHKPWMLMYHDKCFQLDPLFPLIAMNHEQIMKSVNTSFITARCKNFDDHINLLGAARFASVNGQQITSFYSNDQFQGGSVDISTKAGCVRDKNIVDGKRYSNHIPAEQQEIIWSLEPKYTEHKAGRLDLCIGMPVML